MNGRTAKFLRKVGRQEFAKLLANIWKQPFKERMRFAWLIVKGK